MSQARRPAGTPVGGQFAPTDRPEATGIELVDEDLVGGAGTAGGLTRRRGARELDALTSDPVLAHLDGSTQRLAEHLGYAYAAIDDVDEHPGRTTEPGTLGLISYDDGEHFILVGTRHDNYACQPLGPGPFSPGELEAKIADRLQASDRAGGRHNTATRQWRRFRQANTVREGSRSPWGTVDYVSRRAVGITDVGTASHGGVKLSAERNRAVHEAWRRPGGWYEEDCEWAIAAVTFPEAYPPEHVATARKTARNWFPDEYEAVTGEQVQPGESHVRDEALFFAEHANDWVTTAALAADPGTVERFLRDDGDTEMRFVQAEQAMVKVWARVDGRHATAPETRAFLVRKADYDGRGRFGFVVDPDKYEEVAP